MNLYTLKLCNSTLPVVLFVFAENKEKARHIIIKELKSEYGIIDNFPLVAKAVKKEGIIYSNCL